MKERVAAQLQEAAGPAQRGELLIAALYEMSRSVLPELGSPGKSTAYLERQGAVLDLISFIAIQLIREGAKERRGVAVLSEIGEGCLDPLLKRKFSVYAQELLAKSSAQPEKRCPPERRLLPRLIGACAGAVLVLYFAWPITPEGVTEEQQPSAAAAAPEAAVEPAPVYRPPVDAPSPGVAPGAGARERTGAETRQAERPAAEPMAAKSPGEQTTRVRIVNNQVLVPVTLKNGAESVRLELVLDTGATRTAVYEGGVSGLKIDPRSARASQAEVADGRVISSRIAVIDSLSVGPFALAAAELELIPYLGSGRHGGLLGMDFLGRHRYQIDMEHELIRWF
jgi:hypothetical protein